MTVKLSGDGLNYFDRITQATDVSAVTLDLRDSTSQNVILVCGTIGAATDGVYGRSRLLDSSGTGISTDGKMRASSQGTTGTSSWTDNYASMNYYSLGNSYSGSLVSGERLQLMIWLRLYQNTSEPYFDITYDTFSNHLRSDNAHYSSRITWRGQASADPRKMQFFWSSGNVSNAFLYSYIIGSTSAT